MAQDYFMRYEAIEKPVFESALFDNPIDISGWAEGYTPSGNLIIKESSAAKELKSKMNLDYDNVDYIPAVTQSSNLSATSRLDLSGNKKKAIEYFKNKGLSDHQAAGLVGNLIRESGLNPKALNKGSGAMGIAQWLGSRKKNLISKYGKNPTFELQLDYVWEELNSSHKKGLDMLLASKNVDEAAANAFGYYEFSVGPEGAIREMNKYGLNGKESYNQGIKFARELLN